MMENTFGMNIVPDNEADRLEALRRYEITDTPSEESFDGIAKLATQIFNVPISLLSLVDAESVFFKANIGMGKAREAKRGESLCALAILDKNVTVFEDALKEQCLSNNPNVIGKFGLQFYAGAPLITQDGYTIGALCIIDKKPRKFSQADRAILEGLARTAMDQIELRRSAIEKITEVEDANTTLATMQQRLIDLNSEMEATNEQLTKTNIQLSKSYDLTILLNKNLKKSEQRLKSFISKAPIAFAILTGRELTIEVANDMVLKVWGKTSAVIGMPLSEAMPELKEQPYLGILDHVFLSGVTYVGDTAHVLLETDGAIGDHYFDFIYEPLKNDEGKTESIIVIANDVTDRIRKKNKLESLNRQFEIALQAGQLGSYNLDLITGKMECSDTCKENYGFATEGTYGFDDLMQTIIPEHRAIVQDLIENAIKKKTPYHAEYLIRWPDGSQHWMNASGLPTYDTEGNATHMIGVTGDVTKRKNYEAQKDDFLGIASHELKTPITSLKGTIQLLEMLKNKAADDTIPKLIDMCSFSIKKITNLVDDLLNMHRISVGQLELEKENFSLAKMLESCCHDIRLSGRYDLKIEGDADVIMYADEQRIEQVVVNFINNAIKYAPRSNAIDVLVENNREHIKINVRDYGEGMTTEVQSHVFDRYYRANHEGKKYSGLGLGLYISSEIIKRHGGKIGVESEIGEGSTFWFTIPHAPKG